ncbi:restriction endonuclease subunit S [Roseibium sp.]|uniref:restriction endonuclease subunit S n=1 Tax=Roseibium sp. TaxID=1936156 RepID=UPI003A96FDE7
MKLATYPKYESYRESGEGWLEQVPTHWENRKLKHLFQEKKHRTNMDLNCGSISFGEVVEKDDERIPLATKASYQEVLAGEFLVNPLNLNYDLKSLRIGLSNINVVVSAGYIVLQGKGEMDKRFFNYLLHRYDVAYMKLLGSGVRQTISFNHIANSLLVEPPLPEQRAIAAFLDGKCATIDEAVRIKEEQIRLLAERRQILIQQAVTRGLNPDAPMKDSGLDWIGQIPAHWEAVPILAVGAVIDPNPSHRNPEYVDEGFPFISTQEFRPGGRIEIDTPRRVSKNTVEEQEQRCHLQDGSLVFSRKGTIGAVRILPHGIRLGILDSLCVINPNKKVDPKYLYWTLSADYLASQYGPTLRGAALPQLSVGRVRSLKVILPPKDEQLRLTAHLDLETAKIDQAVALKESQITALREYKTSLINAAVTGKIKVL